MDVNNAASVPPLSEVENMFFLGRHEKEDASPGFVSMRLSILLSAIGDQLRTLMDVLDEEEPWNPNMTQSLILAAAALLSRASPLLERLDAIEVLWNQMRATNAASGGASASLSASRSKWTVG